ncbi:MAG: protein kinase domain-containing protein [Myxococcota bacterium]
MGISASRLLVNVVASAGHDGAAEADSVRCLSEATVLAFAEGQMRESEFPALHRHLDRCEDCQELVMEAVRGSALAPTNPDFRSPAGEWNTTFRRGDIVAQRYRIERFIARGGMGEVYEAYDQDLQERVALKAVTSTACDNQVAVRRLKAEVQLARRVTHPNVCRIYDLDGHTLSGSEHQVHFLKMEFVEGRTLGQRLRSEGRLPLEEAIDLACQLLRGLQAAHGAGVLHRDFKSDNVMLRGESGARTTAVILDFGLARSVHERQRGSGSSRQVVGTHGYIAPEQLHGHPFTAASDIYSFGVVLFEMLTGERPFAQTAASHWAEAEPPSRRNAAIPPLLDAVVLGCLRSAPSARYQSAEVVLSRLVRVEKQLQARKRQRSPYAMALSLCALGGVVAVLATPAKSPAPLAHVSSARPQPSTRAATVLVPAPPPSAFATTNAAPQPTATNKLRKPKRAAARSMPAPPPSAEIAQAPASLPSATTFAPLPAESAPVSESSAGRWENPFKHIAGKPQSH